MIYPDKKPNRQTKKIYMDNKLEEYKNQVARNL